MPKKIFELAKELDIGAIDLVEKLRSEGMNVRNHMTALSDEDVEKVLNAYQEEKAQKDAAKKKVKKKTKKKTKSAATKKTAKKTKTTTGEKTTKKVAAKSDVVESSEKKKTVKKKTVIRKKTKASKSKTEEIKTESSSEDAVRLDEATSVEKTKVEEQNSETFEEPSERVHKFTPVYIPKKEESTTSTSATDEAPVERGKTESGEDDADNKSSKKRLGGLASMMSGKKSGVSRSQILNESRSETELKSYATLGGVGRPIYTTIKKKKTYTGPTKATKITEVKDSKRVVTFHGGATALQLAKKLKVKFKELVNKALDLNILLKEDDYLGITLANQIAELYKFRVENKAFDEKQILEADEGKAKKESKLPTRDPVVTIMGHVDHGKTTLLDTIREAKVADGEAGGITQHIGAYKVEVSGKKIAFLDTPGHAAFASMRQRGANVTDIVILVVAADDGVMPQTRESIKFCQEAQVPIIVAVNKMDKEDANPDRVKSELAELGLNPEDWGGETQFVNISALKGDGLDDLLENVLLLAEVLELKVSDKGSAEGTVIESKIEQGRGPVATILVQKGRLKKGENIVVGETYGRARSLMDHTGKMLEEAGPSTPVQILGLGEPPQPGDVLNSVKNERQAKKIADNRANERKLLEATPQKKKMSLEDFFAMNAENTEESKTLNLIVRADVQGSYEAIRQSLSSLSNSEVEVKIVGGGVGPINDSDIQLASSATAVTIGFNMRPSTTARRLAEDLGVDVKTYSIIYELINDVKLAIEGLLEPEFFEQFIGRAEVKETFNVPKIGVIAGSQVIDGKISVGCNIRLLRDGKILHDGKLSSLKRFKDDVKEVKNGFECGIGLENYNDVKVGDLFEAYVMEEKKRTLDDVERDEANKASEETTEASL